MFLYKCVDDKISSRTSKYINQKWLFVPGVPVEMIAKYGSHLYGNGEHSFIQFTQSLALTRSRRYEEYSYSLDPSPSSSTASAKPLFLKYWGGVNFRRKKTFFTFFTFAPAISFQAEMSVLCCNQVGAGFKTGYNLESPTGGWDHNYARLVISGFRLNTIWAKQLCCHNPSILLSSGFFISALNQHHCGSGNIWNTIYSVHATRFHPHWLRRMNWQEAGAVTWLIIITQLNFDSF